MLSVGRPPAGPFPLAISVGPHHPFASLAALSAVVRVAYLAKL